MDINNDNIIGQYQNINNDNIFCMVLINLDKKIPARSWDHNHMEGGVIAFVWLVTL
ncbi:hypothetical protein UKKV901664_16660 [Klebsiella pneumoniae subsp. pneumoniae UKKV901664]|nr:hypothetical protein UKKV901664_16660 [Klebsiella pneumoniae subsp. pneumoniae UKKV901664]